MYILGCILVFVVIYINFNNPVTKDNIFSTITLTLRDYFPTMTPNEMSQWKQIIILVVCIVSILLSWITIGLAGIQFIYKKFIQ